MKGMLGSLLLVAALIACVEPQPAGPPTIPGPPATGGSRTLPGPPGSGLLPAGAAGIFRGGTRFYPPYCRIVRYTSVPTTHFLWYLGCYCRATSSYPYVNKCEGQCSYTGWYPVAGYGTTGRIYDYCYCCAPTSIATVSKRFRCTTGGLRGKRCPLPTFVYLKSKSARGCKCRNACIPD